MHLHKPPLNTVTTTLVQSVANTLFQIYFYRIPCHTEVFTFVFLGGWQGCSQICLFSFSFGFLVLIKKASLPQDYKSPRIFFKKNFAVIQSLIHEMKSFTESFVPKHTQGTGSPQELVKNSFLDPRPNLLNQNLWGMEPKNMFLTSSFG